MKNIKAILFFALPFVVIIAILIIAMASGSIAYCENLMP